MFGPLPGALPAPPTSVSGTRLFRSCCALLIALIVFSAFSPVLQLSGIVTAAAEDYQPYIVAPGDNLWNIAQRFQTTPETLARINGLLDPNHIFVGQRLMVPAPLDAVSAVASTPREYIVAAGDSLWGIAYQFNTTPEAIVLANSLTNPDRIYVGQRLKIPAPREPGQAATGERSLLRNHRMVTYYGIPGKPTMGILGELNPEDLVRSLKARAAELTTAGAKPVLPALHLVAVQALRDPGNDKKSRRRLDAATIQRYVDLGAANGLQVILDLQVGNSTVAEEMEAFRPFLQHPHVHLALDAEYAMPDGVAPGSQLGSLDATDINYAVNTLARIVEQYGLPNKVLMIHQFRPSMITHKEAIVDHVLVDLVINMDGYGAQADKLKWYHILLGAEPVEFRSLQIFLRRDTNPFTPAQALGINPAPDVLVYF